MNRGLLVLLLALTLGGFGYFHFKSKGLATHSHPAYGIHASGHHPEMDWLSEELGVPNERMKAAMALHEAYHPKLEDFTRRLTASRKRLDTLARSGNGVSPELEGALRDDAALKLEARAAMLKHISDTAACLSKDEANRYLEVMLPHAIDGDGHTTETPHSHPHP